MISLCLVGSSPERPPGFGGSSDGGTDAAAAWTDQFQTQMQEVFEHLMANSGNAAFAPPDLSDETDEDYEVIDANGDRVADAESQEGAEVPEEAPSASESASASAEAAQPDLSGMPELPAMFDGLLSGKLGELAKEIAGETSAHLASDLMQDADDLSSPKDMLQHLLSRPDKMMNIMKNVTSKLDQKMKEGDVDHAALASEAANILGKINTMPGMDNLQKMMQQMTGSAAAFGGKSKSTGQSTPRDFQQQQQQSSQQGQGELSKNEVRRRMKQLQMLERLRKKELQKQEDAAVTAIDTATATMSAPPLSDEELFRVFRSGSASEGAAAVAHTSKRGSGKTDKRVKK